MTYNIHHYLVGLNTPGEPGTPGHHGAIVEGIWRLGGFPHSYIGGTYGNKDKTWARQAPYWLNFRTVRPAKDLPGARGEAANDRDRAAPVTLTPLESNLGTYRVFYREQTTNPNLFPWVQRFPGLFE